MNTISFFVGGGGIFPDACVFSSLCSQDEAMELGEMYSRQLLNSSLTLSIEQTLQHLLDQLLSDLIVRLCLLEIAQSVLKLSPVGSLLLSLAVLKAHSKCRYIVSSVERQRDVKSVFKVYELAPFWLQTDVNSHTFIYN